MNNLQVAQSYTKKNAKERNEIVLMLPPNYYPEYTTTTTHTISKSKPYSVKTSNPIDADHEWQHFLSNNISVVTNTPLELVQPRNLRFLNDDHKRTKSLAEAHVIP